MPSTFIADQGDTLCSIAYMLGFSDCEPLRAVNPTVVNRVADACELLVDEIINIPDFEEKEEDGSTEETHNFVIKGSSASIRLVHGTPDLPYANDPTQAVLNISNYITNKGGTKDGTTTFPADSVRQFNSSGHSDVDSFKIEVLDIKAAGDLTVDLEALRPVYNAAGVVTEHKPFDTPRKLSGIIASKCGSTQRFRTCYLRLVTDTDDQAAAPTQTLLTSDLYDDGDSQVEILDQLVKASYEIPTCPASPKCKATVIVPISGTNRRRVRVAVHVLRDVVGGTPIVTTDEAERRILIWVRRYYAQMGIAPKLMQAVREVDPVQNLVSVSNDSGLSARGDGNLTFWIDAPGEAQQTITITPTAGDNPLKSANALAAQLAAPFLGIVTRNPARFNDPAGRGSADIVIVEETGKEVTITLMPLGQDSRQTLTVGRPDPLIFQEWDDNNWLVGSIEQRTILKNFNSGDDRIDIFVISSFVSPDLLGAAMMSGHKVSPSRSAMSQVKWSAFVDIRSSDISDGFPNCIPHECIHVFGEVMHAQSAAQQVMNPTCSPANAVDTEKRLRDGAVTYDGGSIAGNHNIINRVRMEGAPLIEGW